MSVQHIDVLCYMHRRWHSYAHMQSSCNVAQLAVVFCSLSVSPTDL
jgi:hypothetical protein